MTRRHLAGGALCALLSTHAFPSPAESVILPDIERGEREVELALGAARDRDGGHEAGLVLSLGAGISGRWATELGIEFERESGEGLRYDALEWENRLGILVGEDAPLALSLLVGVERPRDRGQGWRGTLGLLSEFRIGRSLVNANLLAERAWGLRRSDDDDEGEADEADDGQTGGTTLGYQWQWLYRHSHRIYYGVHGIGEFGRWNDWAARDDQVHALGPSLFGRVKLDGGRRLNYEAGVLLGLTGATADYTLRVKFEYEL